MTDSLEGSQKEGLKGA